MSIQETLEKLTLEEKARLLCGYSTMATYPVERLGVPSLRFADGPHGVRAIKPGGDSLSGISQSLPATCFPAAVTTACGWDPDKLRRMGEAIGEECRNHGVHVLLGPAVNLKRNPLAGRNFEYFSEDPLLTGTLGAALAEGVESRGVGTSVKHFAANNTENYRFTGDSAVDERALRELYLKPYERIVKQARPATMMCAYNRVNGEFCSQNKWLLTDILRDEWGFDGVVMTDWGAIVDRDKGVAAGLDLEMPGMVEHNVQLIIEGVQQGTLPEETVDKAVANMLRLIDRVYRADTEPCDFETHTELAAEIAADCAVLLKNDGLLPLKQEESYLVIGDLFHYMRYQGSGSSLINPRLLITPEDAFRAHGVHYEYSRGYSESEVSPESELLKEAIAKAKLADKILVFAGQTDYVESEGFDRDTMTLPENQLALLSALAGLGKKLVLVLFGGSPIELPFIDGFDAVLHMLLPGECGGEAAWQLLFGEKNPSGKLAQTWPLSHGDVPYGEAFGKNPVECYRESVYMGYRYYLGAEKAVRYPFGYGLSYTSFAYSGLRLRRTEGAIEATLDITNTGCRDGGEIVQLYVSAPESDVFKPLRELRGFTKAYLKAGETKTVTIGFAADDLRYYNSKEKRWVPEPGRYTVQLGASSTDIRLEEALDITGEAVPSPYTGEVSDAYRTAQSAASVSDAVFEKLLGSPMPTYEMGKRPYTRETTIGEFDTLFGGMIKSSIVGMGKKQYKKACRLPDGPEKEREKKTGLFITKMMPGCSLRSLCFSSGGQMSYELSMGMLELANGRIFRGIRRLMGRPGKK